MNIKNTWEHYLKKILPVNIYQLHIVQNVKDHYGILNLEFSHMSVVQKGVVI